MVPVPGPSGNEAWGRDGQMNVSARVLPLVPAAVVVDYRNVFGAARRQFGSGQEVVVDGVVAALEYYGFLSTSVHVAIGTSTVGHHQSRRLLEALESNRTHAAAVDASRLGRVLHARLVERENGLEEKLADVLCALQIARISNDIASRRSPAQAIVVLSEDMDLIPAYEFATDLGVPVFAAATATVDTRPESSWLLLGEGPLRAACRRPMGRSVGHALRGEIAGWLDAGSPRRLSFKVVAWEDDKDRIRLRHNSGALGYWWHPPREVDRGRGASHELEVCGLDAYASERDFPMLTLSPQATGWPPEGLVRARVVNWKTPTRIGVELPGGQKRTLSAAFGTVLPGDDVLVMEQPTAGQPSWRLVGSLTPAHGIEGWADSTMPELVTVTSRGGSPGARVDAAVASSGQVVALQPPGSDRADVDDVYAAAPIACVQLKDGTSRVVAVAVSSRLPNR